MASEAQITANRQNALKSTGPQTPQGKALVSQNALKHGLSAEKTIIKFENQADFDLHRELILGEFAPTTPIESMLTERVVNLSWRLKRASNIQNHTIDALAAPQTPNPIAKLSQSLLSKYSPSPASDAEPALGQVIIKDFSNARVLERLLMYERRIEHSLYKTILELQRLNMIKRIKAEKGIEIGQI